MPDYQKNTLEKRKYVANPKRSRPMSINEILQGQFIVGFTGRMDSQYVNLFHIGFATEKNEYRLQITAEKAKMIVDFFTERLGDIERRKQIESSKKLLKA